MTRFTGDFPNVHAGVIAWLKAELPADGFVIRNSVLPDDWPGPGTKVTVVVSRTAGTGPSREMETAASIDVDLYADTLDHLGDAIPVVSKAMAQIPPTVFDEVGLGAFGDLPYANTKIRRAGATFDIETRAR